MSKEFDLKGYAKAAEFLQCDRSTIIRNVKSGIFHQGKHYSRLSSRIILFSSSALTDLLKIPPAQRKVKTG